MIINTQPINPLPNGELEIYSERAITFSAVFGGPLAGTYFLASNYRAFGKDKEYKWTWIIGISITLIVFGTIILLPESFLDKLPSQLSHFLWGLPAYLLVKHYQIVDIKRLEESGVKYGSWWKVIGYSIALLAITLLYSFGVALILEPDIPSVIPDFDRSEVQMEYSKCSIFYDKINVSEVEAKVVGSLLEEFGYFQPGRTNLDALVYREGNYSTIMISFPTKALNDSKITDEFHRLLTNIERLYPDKSYRFRLIEKDSNGEITQVVIE
jgi:hypothetical protein